MIQAKLQVALAEIKIMHFTLCFERWRDPWVHREESLVVTLKGTTLVTR
jgi:hypothetical protein